jgi:hypothetical protein
MLNHVVFSTWMTVIGERLGKEISAPVQNTYRAAFDRRQLTDAEFVAAAQGIFEHWTGFGLPSVDDFVRFARPVATPRSAAVESLRLVQARVARREVADLEDPRVLAAWRAVGGATAILNAGESEWPHLERRWIAAFTEAGDLEARTRDATERIARVERQLGELGRQNGSPNHIGTVLPRAIPAEVPTP